ncbi:hypothetical protein BJV74DRAFT_858747 [Russula compacta]|nr:hypothetical protein BJV74DRAFT_858747 [Russula compacta]
MILLEEDTLQRPKLPTDPSLGPTNRVPLQTERTTPGSSQRPPSPNPTLPDYETSEAQQPSNQKRWGRHRFWHTRVGRLTLYAIVLYSSVLFVIGIPVVVLRSKSHKFKWHADDSFADYMPLPPPPLPLPPDRSQMDLSSHALGVSSVSCKAWAEPVAVPEESTTSMVGMHLTFPLGEGIALWINSSSRAFKGYLSGNLTVDMNPDESVNNTVLVANSRYSDTRLIKESSVCLTQFGNTTEITIHIPERAENSSDTIDMDLRLLLPRMATPIHLENFATHLPMVKQVLGDLSDVFFKHLNLIDSDSSITVGSVVAASIIARTSGAKISGNFSATNKIHLDTINGAVYANISLHNSKKLKRNTKLSIETGNGPIVADVKLSVDERIYFSVPKHQNFATKFKTFNAPMDISISHVKQSKPARITVYTENTQGPIDLSLDSLYMGAFDVRSKGGTAQVQNTAFPGVATSSSVVGMDDNHNEMHELHFVQLSPDRARGWIGDSRRPEQFDRHSLSRVELVNSLSPIRLHLAYLRSSTAIR